MATAREHEEQYLGKELYYGLWGTPVWARETLVAHDIKTVADLIELAEDEVREILQTKMYRRSKVKRAMTALINDLETHNRRLAG